MKVSGSGLEPQNGIYGFRLLQAVIDLKALMHKVFQVCLQVSLLASGASQMLDWTGCEVLAIGSII